MTKLERYQQLRDRVDREPAHTEHAEETRDQVLQLLDELIAAEGGKVRPTACKPVQITCPRDIIKRVQNLKRRIRDET